MREHKFRAWDKENKRMLAVHSLYADAVGIRKDGRIWLYERKQFVVMQSAGLRDRHAQDIYEGDIVQQRFYIEDEYHNGDHPSFGYHVGAVRILASRGVCITKPITHRYSADLFAVDVKVLMTAPLEVALEQCSDDLGDWGLEPYPTRYVQLRGSRCEVIGNIYENPGLLEVAA